MLGSDDLSPTAEQQLAADQLFKSYVHVLYRMLIIFPIIMYTCTRYVPVPGTWYLVRTMYNTRVLTTPQYRRLQYDTVRYVHMVNNDITSTT